MTETITSPHNEKLKLVRRLTARRGREREGMFTSEGEDLLEAGLAAGCQPHAVLVASGSGLPGTEVEPDLLDAASVLGSGTRVIAIWELPEAALAPERCVYLHGVADPGNVGTIARSAAALWDAPVVLGPGCADAFSPKAVRAGMGAHFSHPPSAAGVGATPEPRLALVAHGGADLDRQIARHRPRTVCLGAERHGLDEATLRACAATATIPLRAGAESLNVAASAAIALHRISSGAAPDQEGPAGAGEGQPADA